MNIWLVALLAAATATLAQLMVPRQLRGRPSSMPSEAHNKPRTSTLQALVLLAEAIAWGILVAVAAALAVSMTGAATPIHSPMLPAAIGLIAAALTAGVIVALSPARAEARLERRIARLSRAASAGTLPPLPPSPEMQALMEPIASVNRDIAALERLGNGNPAAAELADLHKMRDGLVELFIEKDLARRINTLRSEAPGRKSVCRSVGWLESLGAMLLRDRLIGLLPAPAAASLALGVYAVFGLAAAWLAAQSETGLLAQQIASRAGEIVRVAEAHAVAPQQDAGAEQRPVVTAIRTANLAINTLSDSSSIAINAALPASATRDAAAEQEIAALTLKLEETETKLERAEQALREARAEQQRLLGEAERTRDVDVATVASNAQLERMAHEAAMAIEEERLRQKELELAQRLAELEENKAALRAEKQRLVAMIEDRRRQATAWEARVRLERIEAAAEARADERQAMVEGAKESKRFGLEERRLEERKRIVGTTNVNIADGTMPGAAEIRAYVPASAPAADELAAAAEPAEPVELSGTSRVAVIDPADTQRLREAAGPPTEQTVALSTVTLPAAQDAVAKGPRTPAPPLSPLAALECDRVRADTERLGDDAFANEPAVTGSRKAKLSLETVRALLDCGQALMTTGDLNAARFAFGRVADAGIAKGALALGTTFDPHALAKANLDGSSANTKLARFWYKRALKLSGQ